MNLIERSHHESSIRITRRWWSRWTVVGFVVGVPLLIWVVLSVPPILWGALLVGSAMLAMGVITLVNRTVITVEPERIEVRRGPLPHLGRRVRTFAPFVSVHATAERIATAGGAAGTGHYVWGTEPSGEQHVIDITRSAAQSDEMVKQLRAALQVVG